MSRICERGAAGHAGQGVRAGCGRRESTKKPAAEALSGCRRHCRTASCSPCRPRQTAAAQALHPRHPPCRPGTCERRPRATHAPLRHARHGGRAVQGGMKQNRQAAICRREMSHVWTRKPGPLDAPGCRMSRQGRTCAAGTHMAAAVSPTRQGVLGMTRTTRALSPAAACRARMWARVRGKAASAARPERRAHWRRHARMRSSSKRGSRRADARRQAWRVGGSACLQRRQGDACRNGHDGVTILQVRPHLRHPTSRVSKAP